MNKGRQGKDEMGQINSFRDLIVYQKAYKLAMEIFEITKSFPKGKRIKWLNN